MSCKNKQSARHWGESADRRILFQVRKKQAQPQDTLAESAERIPTCPLWPLPHSFPLPSPQPPTHPFHFTSGAVTCRVNGCVSVAMAREGAKEREKVREKEKGKGVIPAWFTGRRDVRSGGQTHLLCVWDAHSSWHDSPSLQPRSLLVVWRLETLLTNMGNICYLKSFLKKAQEHLTMVPACQGEGFLSEL